MIFINAQLDLKNTHTVECTHTHKHLLFIKTVVGIYYLLSSIYTNSNRNSNRIVEEKIVNSGQSF